MLWKEFAGHGSERRSFSCMWQQGCLIEIMENRMDSCGIVCDQGFSETPKVSKLKLLFEKRENNSTPVSAICESLLNTVIESGNRNLIEKNEPMLVEIASPHDEIPVPSQCQTPVSSHIETPIPPQIHISQNNPVTTPACSTPVKLPLLKEVINSTPRRNPRRSCAGRLTVCSSLSDARTHQTTSNSSEGDALHCAPVLPISSIVGDTDKFADISALHDGEVNVLNCEKESLHNQADCHLSNNISDSLNDGHIIVKDQRCPSQSFFNDVLKRKLPTEPRPKTRKSDVSVSFSRKLSFSSRRSSFKRKSIIEEYDPDNDIFAHGVVPTHFNIDSLKNEIGKFLSNSDVPTSKLVRSQSCGVLNIDDNEEATRSPSSTPKRKSKASRSPKKDTFKRALSAPNLLESVSSVTKPCSDPPKEGTVRAFLRARDIIKNIQKRKILCQDKVSSVPGVSNAKDCDNASGKQLASSLKYNQGCGTLDNDSFQMNDSVSDTDHNSTDFSLAPTQPFESVILKDVTAYVEVISNNENISGGVRKELIKLGATVVPNFNKDVPVTHVVFNDGHISTYKKAKKRHIPLVSVLWIEECRKAGLKVDESLYPPYQIERYESPNIVKQLKKRRILHSVSDDRPRPSLRRKKGIPKNGSLTTSDDLPQKMLSIRRRSSVPKWLDQAAGDNGMVRILVNMTGVGPGEFKDIVRRPPTPDSETGSNIDSPLAVRLLRKLAKNVDVSCDVKSASVNQNYNTSGDVIRSSQTVTSCNINEINESEIPKTEENVMLEGLNTGNVSSDNSVQFCDLTLANVTQRKKHSKKRLLTTVDEIISLPDDGGECIAVINPHSSSKSGDNVRKKRRTSNSSNCPQDTGESLESYNPEGHGNLNDKRGENKYPIRRSRRSSAYFINKDNTKASQVTQKPAIVCSLLHSVEVDVVASIIEKLGVYVLERSVSSHTTHIVIGAAKRTMKVLKGMVRGCWIVSHEWVLKSLEANKWLEEEEFEMTSFSPALQKYRLEKLSFGATFKPDIFGSCGPIFVSSKSTAPRGDLVELILLCGGRIVSRVGRAAIVVGKKHPGVQCVTALWVLDSITVYCCKPFDSYLFS